MLVNVGNVFVTDAEWLRTCFVCFSGYDFFDPHVLRTTAII